MTSKQARGVPAEVGRSFGPGRLDELADVRSRTCTSDALGLRHALVGDDAGGRRLVCRCRSARVGNGSRHRRPRSVPPAGGRPRRSRTPSATPRTIAHHDRGRLNRQRRPRRGPSSPWQHEVGWRGTPMDDALRPVDLDRRPVGLHGGDLAAGDGSTKWRGTPMDDALPPDLDRRPVGAHGDDLAAGDAPEQTGAL